MCGCACTGLGAKCVCMHACVKAKMWSEDLSPHLTHWFGLTAVTCAYCVGLERLCGMVFSFV